MTGHGECDELRRVLFAQVDRQVACPSDTSPIRIKRFQLSDKVYREGRCVCVESAKPDRSLAIFFFRHDDGLWYVFPSCNATGDARRLT